MADELLRTLRREARDLEDRLEGNAEFKRWKLIQSLIHEYQRTSSSLQSRNNSRSMSQEISEDKNQYHNEGVREAAYDILRKLDGPLPIRDLMDEIISKGLRVGGSNPTANLSTQLSRDDRFASLGREGWTLEKNIKADEPTLDQMLDDLADHLLTDTEMASALSEHIEKKRLGIPGEVDGWLLRQSNQYFTRRLTDDEKIYLREQVRDRAINGSFVDI